MKQQRAGSSLKPELKLKLKSNQIRLGTSSDVAHLARNLYASRRHIFCPVIYPVIMLGTFIPVRLKSTEIILSETPRNIPAIIPDLVRIDGPGFGNVKIRARLGRGCRAEQGFRPYSCLPMSRGEQSSRSRVESCEDIEFRFRLSGDCRYK